MPKIVNGLPKYRRHSSRDKAFVVLNGQRIYLPGPFKSPESRQEYRRLLLEWETLGRTEKPPASDTTVAELAAKYWKHARQYFRKNGAPTGTAENYRPALRLLKKYYGLTPAAEFGPLALKSLRTKMIAAGNSRGYINENVSRICKVFRWGVSEELVAETIWRALKSVESLPKGRSAARETAPIQPVEDSIVELTLPHLPAVVADMVRFQRLVGCRSAEVCQLRPCDVDTSGPVWIYIPRRHKTEHKGKARTIFIGPQAKEILRPYLTRDPSVYCFSPRESESKRRIERHQNRKTPLSCGHTPGSNKRRRPQRSAGVCYTKDSYRRAVVRACAKAFPAPRTSSKEQKRKWNREHAWHPHRLRHTAGTAVRKRFGLEATQVFLGHSKADVTQVYAESDLELGRQVAEAIG